jgi:hypothetical protein
VFSASVATISVTRRPSSASAARISFWSSYAPTWMPLDSGSPAAASMNAWTDLVTPSALRLRPIWATVSPSLTVNSTEPVPGPG